jgi:hypothetical protein
VNVYPFIEAERAKQRNVKRACALLEVSRAAFYDWVRHVPSPRLCRNENLLEKIKAVPRGQQGHLRIPARACAAAQGRRGVRAQSGRPADAGKRHRGPSPTPLQADDNPGSRRRRRRRPRQACSLAPARSRSIACGAATSATCGPGRGGCTSQP